MKGQTFFFNHFFTETGEWAHFETNEFRRILINFGTSDFKNSSLQNFVHMALLSQRNTNLQTFFTYCPRQNSLASVKFRIERNSRFPVKSKLQLQFLIFIVVVVVQLICHQQLGEQICSQHRKLCFITRVRHFSEHAVQFGETYQGHRYIFFVVLIDCVIRNLLSYSIQSFNGLPYI